MVLPVAPLTPRHFGACDSPGRRADFAWQAWHLRDIAWHKLTSTVVLRGRRGTYGTGWRAWAGIWSPVTPGAPRHFAWQAWHKLTSTVVLRGRRGTTSHPPSFCVAGVALMALGGALGLAWSPVTPVTPRHFAWQAWHKPHILPSFCVAGVSQSNIHDRFAWQAWHKLTSTVVSCLDRRGTARALPVTPRHFAWQAWLKLSSSVVLCGRRGTFCVAGVAQPHYPPSFCVAGMALIVLVVLRLDWFGRP